MERGATGGGGEGEEKAVPVVDRLVYPRDKPTDGHT